ncbi:MAG TPA: sigma-70 family RNA polymerase sigma factor [Dehalococcoidia bacterium]|nr:sigma-70 family RNA polymerase sigma factor [Dehalococcoidia bacterium]
MNKTAILDTARIRAANSPRTSIYDGLFSAAYEAYSTKIFAFIYSRVHDVELTKDLVSIVFERAYQKGDTLRDPAAYGAWLFMIARNTINGHFRKAAREYRYLGRAGEELRFVDGPPLPEDALLRDERVGKLIEQMVTLPRRDRELLSLKFDAELTNAEIGRIMCMSPLNVRVAIFRALRKLRANMEKADHETGNQAA